MMKVTQLIFSGCRLKVLYTEMVWYGKHANMDPAAV